MNVTRDSSDSAEGMALLNEVTHLYSAVLKTSRIEPEPRGKGVVCIFEVPTRGQRFAHAHTAGEAITKMLVDLHAILSEFTTPKQWPEAWHQLASSVSITLAEGSMDTPKEHGEFAERFRSKHRQLTIGVTSSSKLEDFVQRLANKNLRSFAEEARHLATQGFEDFDERIFSESPIKLLDHFQSELRRWASEETGQWMLRLDPKVAVRMRLTAKEYGKSASEFAAMCLAHALTLEERSASRGTRASR